MPLTDHYTRGQMFLLFHLRVIGAFWQRLGKIKAKL